MEDSAEGLVSTWRCRLEGVVLATRDGFLPLFVAEVLVLGFFVDVVPLDRITPLSVFSLRARFLYPSSGPRSSLLLVLETWGLGV